MEQAPGGPPGGEHLQAAALASPDDHPIEERRAEVAHHRGEGQSLGEPYRRRHVPVAEVSQAEDAPTVLLPCPVDVLHAVERVEAAHRLHGQGVGPHQVEAGPVVLAVGGARAGPGASWREAGIRPAMTGGARLNPAGPDQGADRGDGVDGDVASPAERLSGPRHPPPEPPEQRRGRGCALDRGGHGARDRGFQPVPCGTSAVLSAHPGGLARSCVDGISAREVSAEWMIDGSAGRTCATQRRLPGEGSLRRAGRLAARGGSGVAMRVAWFGHAGGRRADGLTAYSDQTVAALAAAGCEIRFFHHDLDGDITPVADAVPLEGVRFKTATLPAPRTLARIERALADFRPDVVHCSVSVSLLDGAVARVARGLGAATVATCHLPYAPAQSARGRVMRRLYQYHAARLQEYDRCIALSDDQRDLL